MDGYWGTANGRYREQSGRDWGFTLTADNDAPVVDHPFPRLPATKVIISEDQTPHGLE